MLRAERSEDMIGGPKQRSQEEATGKQEGCSRPSLCSGEPRWLLEGVAGPHTHRFPESSPIFKLFYRLGFQNKAAATKEKKKEKAFLKLKTTDAVYLPYFPKSERLKQLLKIMWPSDLCSQEKKLLSWAGPVPPSTRRSSHAPPRVKLTCNPTNRSNKVNSKDFLVLKIKSSAQS